MATIIFDFDGTIVDSRDYFIRYIARAAGKPLRQEELEELHGLPLVAVARRLGHPWWRLPRLYIDGRRQMNRALPHLDIFHGMGETIRKLHAEGHELFIVSSNSVHNIHAFLRQHNLHRYFLEIYGGVVLFGKAPALRRLVKEHNFEMKSCFYVGDELRDVEASHAVGMRVIAVAWGFARHEDLEAQKPTSVVHSPAELLSILEEA